MNQLYPEGMEIAWKGQAYPVVTRVEGSCLDCGEQVTVYKCGRFEFRDCSCSPKDFTVVRSTS